MAIDDNQLMYSIPAHRFSRLGCTTFWLNTPGNEWYQVAGCKVGVSFVVPDPALTLSVNIQGWFVETEVLVIRFVLQNNYGHDLINVAFTELLPVDIVAPAAVSVADGESIAMEFQYEVTAEDVTAGLLSYSAAGAAEYDNGITVAAVTAKAISKSIKTAV